jgi:hypothetical protein
MQSRVARIFLIVSSALLGVLCAQQRGQYILGSNGLNSGIQPAAGFSYLNMPGLYSASRLKAADGSPINTAGTFDLDTDQNFFIYTSKVKFLGGTYGAAFDLILANASIVAPQIGVSFGGEGITDSFVQPVMLGYHYSRVDFTVALGLLVPTGRYTRPPVGGNLGSGYWGYMPSAGATIYLTKNKGTTFSGFGLYEFHGTKRYSEVRPGQTFNFEGGLGQIIPLGKTLFQIGAVGYGQWQTTADNGPVLPAIRDARYSVAAAGPQASVIVPKWNLSFFFRYEPEFAASSTTEGTTMMFGASISFPVAK